MADKDLTVHLKADDNITPVAKKAAAELKKLEKPIELDADVSGVLSALDQVTAEAKATAEAADVLARALGPELSAQADTTRVVGDLRDMGLTLDQIKGNADELAAKMKELSDADVGGKLGGSLGTARGKIDEVSDSARGANSALANMIGNTTQDLGAMSGVAGSLGVALGQMGEYAADAALGGEKLSSSLLSMTKIAGPIAGIALATKAVSDVMERFRASQERTNASVQMWEDALASGGDATEAYADALREVGEVLLDVTRSQSAVANVVGEANDSWWKMSAVTQIVGKALGASGDETRDLTKTLGQAQIGVDRWAEAVEGGGPAARKMADYLAQTNLTADEQKDILLGLSQAQADHAKAAENDATATKFFGDETEKATDATKDYHRELARTEADRKTADRVQHIKDMAAATIEAKEAMGEFNDTLASADWAAADVAGAAAGMSAWADTFFGIPARIAESEAAIDSFVEAIKENTLTFDLNTEAGRQNQEALEGVAKTLEDDFSKAYVDADGDLNTFKASAKTISDTTLARMQTELGLTDEEVETLRTHLGLTAQDWEARFILSGDAEAMQRLALVQGVLSDIDDEAVQAEITTKILMGDYQGAVADMQAYLNGHPGTIKITPVLQAARNLVVPPGVSDRSVTATATATGPATTYAAPVAYAAPTVRVPVSVPSLTFNVGVIGNRFDSQRAITKALRAHQRLNGDRA